MIASFVIFLREGFEAALIVSVLLSFLDRSGQRKYFKDVFVGVASAVVLITAIGIVIYLTVSGFVGSTGQTIFETVTFLIATVSLTYMTFWMRSHGRRISLELEEKGSEALTSGSRLAMASLAFLSVGREGLETMIFMLAIVFASTSQSPVSGHSPWMILGAVAGLGASMGLAYAVFKLGAKINLRRFFLVLGIVLLIFAAGLLVDAIENLQQLGWISFGMQPLWHSGSVISENSSLGDILHVLFGYAQSPTVLQAIVWVAFLAVTLTLFARMPSARPGSAQAQQSSV